MQSLFDDHSRRADLRARSLQRATQFTWEQTARATYNVYRDILAA
jgi:hypothetical protein